MAFQKKQPEAPKAKVEVVVPATEAEKFAKLFALSSIIDKKHDTTNSILRLGNRVGVAIPSIPLGCPSFDIEVLGCGGVPRGRIVEIFGPESAGKTTAALSIVAAEQAHGGICAVVDAEHALDPTYAAALGVNVDKLVISQPDSGEQALDITLELVKSQCVTLIVVDSVAALTPQAELDGEMGDSHVGLQARMMSQAMRKLRGICNINQVTVIFINQIREKIGVMFGSPETTTGGRALKFYSSVRLDVRRREVIGEKEAPIGHQLEIKAVKNKMGAPFRSTILDLYYPGVSVFSAGFDKIGDLISYASKRGMFQMSGSWYYLDLGNKDEKTGKPLFERIANGLANLKIALRDNQKVLDTLRAKVAEILAAELAQKTPEVKL
jgi:recombination protein RecA